MAYSLQLHTPRLPFVMKRLGRYWLVWLLIWTASLSTTAEARRTPSQTAPPYAAEARLLLSTLSPAERVGQLFLVTFTGTPATPESGIYTLITDYHVGGVVLSAANDNLVGDAQTLPTQVYSLTTQLQTAALTGQTTISQTAVPPAHPLPLLMALDSADDLHSGLTELPSPLSLGATWTSDYATAVADQLGRELSSLGINLFFGPSLDIMETPQLAVTSQNRLGTAVFGGSPYWVSRMGQAYIAGLQAGSNGRLAIMPTHFPGAGSSDRAGYREIATVRKSLVELQQSDLLPFSAITQGAFRVDGLLSAHVRYQGFQGNIRASTPPVSFDPQAIESLLRLGQLPTWRAEGGILTSNPLGVPAIERFYDNTGQAFPHRQVAKDALLAGNDLLYLGEFALGNDPAQEIANIEDTILWFQDKYATDPAFQQRVDDAVVRILQLKLRLYEGDFSLAAVLPDPAGVAQVGQGANLAFTVAQEALTLLAPTPEELLERLPGPPTDADRLVVFTDVRPRQQCSGCPPTAVIGPNTIAEHLLALYGPESSGQIQPSQVQSFSFAQLQRFLEEPGPIALPPTPAPTPTPTDEELVPNQDPLPQPTPSTQPALYAVQEAIAQADWLVFAMLDVQLGTDSAALKNLLAERPDLIAGKRVIVIAFDAPYYLDTTEVSKLTAYFGVYSTGPNFIDAALRALFRDLTVRGASPVSVDGVGYSLRTAVSPAPNQIIALNLELNGTAQPPSDGTALDLAPGTTLRLRTGVILDRNGRPVPDGTLVQFSQQDRIQGFFSVIAEAPTRDGVASFDYVLEARTGQFRITAATGFARTSEEVNIAIGENVSVIVLSPTPMPTPTATATATPTPTAEPLPTLTPQPSPTPLPLPDDTLVQVNIARPQLQQLLALMAGLGLVWGAAVALNESAAQKRPPAQQFQRLLWGLVGGLLVYNYHLWGLPGTAALPAWGAWLSFLLTLFGGFLALAVHAVQDRK